MEKRFFSRITKPGMSVRYRKNVKFFFLNRYSSPQTVRNISRCGACVLFQHEVRKGDLFCLQITLPNYGKITVKGVVVWAKPDKSSTDYCAGIKFLPFGTLKELNPLSALKVLKSIASE